MPSSLTAVLDVARACAVGALYLLVVGAAVRLVLARVLSVPKGVGITIGLGLATTGLLSAWSYVAVGDAVAPVVALPVVAGIALAGLGVAAAVRANSLRDDFRTLLPTRWDAIALGATVVVLAPLAVHGLTYWTALANDFPNYAASVQVWVADSGYAEQAFRVTHPDAYGQFQENRAGYEKPMATGVLVALSTVTGTPSTQLLAPAIVLAFVVLLAAMLPLVHRAVASSTLTTSLVVVVPSFSIVPLSRVQDAQIGHLLAVALLAVSLVLLTSPPVTTGFGPGLVRAVVVGGVVAATVGSNATLVLGTGVGTAALLGWIVLRTGTPWRRAVRSVVAATSAALLMSVPFVGWYAKSFGPQAGGEAGYEIPLAAPSALIGMQTSLRSVPPLEQALVEWGVVLALAVAGYLTAKTLRPGLPVTGSLVVATALNGALIVAVNGVTSYTAHKWLSVVVALSVPFLLARLVQVLPRAARPWATPGLVGLAAGATTIAVVTANAVPVVAPTSLFALRDSADLAAQDVVNVELGDIYQNALAPLVVPTPVVISAGRTYSTSTPPRGTAFLLRADDLDAWGSPDVTDLGGGYVLADVDLTLRDEQIGSENPAGRRFLYGPWADPEPGGVWSTGQSSTIVFDVPDDARGHDIEVRLTGTRFSTPDEPRDLLVQTGGLTVARATYDQAFELSELVVPLSSAVVEAQRGRVELVLRTPEPLSPADLGQEDARPLGYWLARATLVVAA